MKARTIVLYTFGLTVCLTALSITAIVYPSFLKPVIALGLPTEQFNRVPILRNAILAAKAPQISPNELQLLQKNEDVLLIDVRTTAEFDRSHIPGAIHIPLRDIEDGSGIKTIEALQQQNPKTIVTYCHSGTRSNRSIDRLHHLGIEATNLTGGIVRWRDTIDPTLELSKS